MLSASISSVAQNNVWVAKSPMPSPREEHASCLIGQYVYLLGGAEEKASPVLSRIDRYNIETDTWDSPGDMPTARRTLTASAVDGKCYTIGGTGAGDDGLTIVDEYDPATNTWTPRSDMPTARQALASAVIDNIIYVVGGDDGGIYLNTLEAYDPITDSWSTLAPMNTSRGWVAATAVNGKLYVMGGNISAGNPVDTVDEYDPATNRWSEVAAMPSNLFFLTASTVGDKIYAIGGATGAAGVDEVNVYDFMTDTWAPGVPMLAQRNRHTSEVIRGAIYVFGGATAVGGIPHGTKDTVEAFQAEEYSFSINAGHSGAWYNPDTSGQGQLIDVVPEDQFMFLAWFTFTDSASSNPDQQHWYTAQGNYAGNTAELILHETLGGRFDDPQLADTNPVGTVTVSFTDCEQGQMAYSIDTDGREGSIPLQRLIPGSENICEGQGGQATITTEVVDINAGMDGAWYDTDKPGQGFLIDAHPNSGGGNFIFVAWFTYGDETASGQRWLTAQGDFAGSTAEIDVYETTGGRFNDSQLTGTEKVGTMTIDFEDCSNAQLSYSLIDDDLANGMQISRLIPGGRALCEELAVAQ